MISFQGILNLSILYKIVLINRAIIAQTKVLYSDMIINGEFVDFKYLGLLYYDIMKADAQIVGLVCVRLVLFLQNKPQFDLMIKTMERALASVTYNVIVVIPIYLAFSLFAMNIWGRLIDFYTVGNALLSTIGFTMHILDVDKLYQ